MALDAGRMTNDERARDAVTLFRTLSSGVLRAAMPAEETQARLWQLPEVVAYYAYGALTDGQRARLDPLVHELRLESAALITRSVDRTSIQTALRDRLATAHGDFQLRPWQLEEASTFASLLDDPRVWQSLPEAYPGQIGPEVARQLITIANGWPDRHLVRAALYRGAVVGQVRLQFDSSAYRDSAEISYWLGAKYWGRGLATSLVTLFTAQCFSLRPGLERIFARVLEGHEASRRVLEKSGYRHESFQPRGVEKDGRTCSISTLAVCRPEYAFDREPRQAGRDWLALGTLIAAMQSDGWKELLDAAALAV
jgi:RimJ/RimL family protein N-acetyltransferase